MEGGIVAQFRKEDPRFHIELLLPFNGVHPGPHLTQYGRLVSRTGPHLQHLAPTLHMEQFGHEGYGIRLRNGLSGSDGKRLVTVGKTQETALHENVPGDFSNGGQHLLIPYSLDFQCINKALPHTLMTCIVDRSHSF